MYNANSILSSGDHVNTSMEAEAMKSATDLYIKLSSSDPSCNKENMFNKINEFYQHFLSIFRKSQNNSSLSAVQNTNDDLIKKTVFYDYIICLEDGKKMQTLKRHLKKFNLTPEQYIRKWNLPFEYPMVCESYSKKRVEIATTTTDVRVKKMKIKKEGKKKK